MNREVILMRFLNCSIDPLRSSGSAGGKEVKNADCDPCIQLAANYAAYHLKDLPHNLHFVPAPTKEEFYKVLNTPFFKTLVEQSQKKNNGETVFKDIMQILKDYSGSAADAILDIRAAGK